MDIEQRISQLLERMTLREKLGQLNQIVIKDNKEIRESICRGDVGSIIIAETAFAGNDESEGVHFSLLNELQHLAVEESPSRIPIIYGRDVIHGFGVVLPVPLAMTASWNMELIERGAQFLAQAAAREGVHWTFTPMLDCSRDARWGRMVEGPGEDPHLGAEIAKAFVHGFQGDDVSSPNAIAACAKHYIGYGASEGGRDYHSTEITDYTLRNYYLPAFRAAVEAGCKTVMSSFNEIGGQPVTSSRYLLTDVLRGELNFQGFVVSDWAGITQLKTQGVAEDDAQACCLSLNAGVDMEMITGTYRKHAAALLEAGQLSMETVDEAVRRILRVKMECGLFDRPFARPEKVDMDGFMDVAFALASESMVLLKNNDVLPVPQGKKIALIGPMVQEKRSLLGTWTLDYDIRLVSTMADSFAAVYGRENILTSSSPLYDEQRLCALQADVILLALGESYRMTGENNSLAEIELDAGQKQLLRYAHGTGKPVIVLLACARPIAMRDIEPLADAILYVWHCGTKTADAAAQIVCGAVSPSGKLPVTLPAVTGQVPVYYNATSPARIREMGYYRDVTGGFMYPFGYGLSYGRFRYTDLRISEDAVSLESLQQGKKVMLTVDVENYGAADAKETVQLYIRDRVATMTRPVRELKSFQKILIPQNTKAAVCFEIGFNELAFYNAQGVFCVEKGKFELYVGGDSRTEMKKILTVQ